jgi:hypothetical protein
MKSAALKKKREKIISRIVCSGVGIAACLAIAIFGIQSMTKDKADFPEGGKEAADQAGTVAYTASLSINPSVEFQIGGDGMTVAVVGTNDDGTALIEGIDFAGLSFENAAIVVVNRLIEENYITASTVQDNIMLSVSGGSQQKNMLEVMSSVIQSAASQYGLSLDTVKTDENQLEIILAGQPAEPAEGELPAVGENELPVSLAVEYNLTGFSHPIQRWKVLILRWKTAKIYFGPDSNEL